MQEHDRGEELTYSIKEAAKLLRVAESTVWRWIDKGQLKARRVSPRRLRIRANDLRAVAPEKVPVPQSERRTTLYGLPIEVEDIPEIRAALDLHRKILARRKGKPLPSSVDEIRKSREIWGRDY